MARRKNKVKVMVATQVQPAKTNRNRRRRARKRLNKKGGLAMGRMPRSRDGAAFMRAALDPFSDVSLPAVGVPDSYGGDTLKHWNEMEISVTPDSNGNIAFIVLPTVSAPLLCIQGNYNSVLVPVMTAAGNNAGTATISFNAASIGAVSANTKPAIGWPQWVFNQGAGGLTTAFGNSGGYGPYSYKSQRIISQGLEWRYTGTTLNDQGSCIAATLDAYSLGGYNDYTPAAYPATISTDVRFTVRTDVSTLANQSFSTLANYPKYVIQSMKGTEGAGGMVVLISGEDGYQFSTFDPYAMMIDAPDLSNSLETGTTGAIGIYGHVQSTTNAAFFPISPIQNLRPVAVYFTGLASGVSLVLKLKQCIEATVAVGSPFAPFTNKSPNEDLDAIAIVADVQKTLPVMVPVTMNGFGDWWRKIMRTIGGVGRIAGSLGIPFVSPIAAGVGQLADVLGDL